MRLVPVVLLVLWFPSVALGQQDVREKMASMHGEIMAMTLTQTLIISLLKAEPRSPIKPLTIMITLKAARREGGKDIRTAGKALFGITIPDDLVPHYRAGFDRHFEVLADMVLDKEN